MLFETAEFEARTARAQTMMAEQGLDALFVTTEPEVRYFTGFQTRFWESPCRPWFLVIPATGKPIAVIPAIGQDLMSRCWVGDIRTWPAPQPDDEGVSLLIDTLKPFARVGTPMGQQSSLRMPVGDWLRVTASHPIESDGGIIQRLRLIKSDAEVALTRNACAVAGRAFARVPEMARIGTPLSEVFRGFQQLALQEGADWVMYLSGAAAPGGYSDVISAANDRPLTEGDVLMIDTGVVKDGYFSDFDRNWSIGQPADDVSQAHAKLIQASDAAFAAAKPGAKASDLWRAMADIVGATDTGRLGHGLGMNLTEWPSLTADDHTIIQTGMILTLEPGIEIAPNRMLVHEENIVITDTGAEFLSPRIGPDIPVIQ